MENSIPPGRQLTQMVTGYAITQAIYSAAKLNIAEHIKDGKVSTASDLAEKTGADADGVYRLLRALASVGIFEEKARGEFDMTPMAELLAASHPKNVKAMVLGMGHVFYPAYQKLLYSVEHGGGGFKEHHGVPVFEYFNQHQEQAKIFDRMMTDFHGGETRPMVEKYDFSGFGTVVDVGGGNGEVLATLLNAYPDLKGVLFDLPHVTGRSVENVKQWGVDDRCKCVGGDFFKEVPEGGDAYILRHIVHDWSDEEATKILSNCCQAMNPNGKVLIVEAVIPPGNTPHPYKWLDLTMLLIGGKERTEAQFRTILDNSCLQFERIIPITPEVSIVEAKRKGE